MFVQYQLFLINSAVARAQAVAADITRSEKYLAMVCAAPSAEPQSKRQKHAPNAGDSKDAASPAPAAAVDADAEMAPAGMASSPEGAPAASCSRAAAAGAAPSPPAGAAPSVSKQLQSTPVTAVSANSAKSGKQRKRKGGSAAGKSDSDDDEDEEDDGDVQMGGVDSLPPKRRGPDDDHGDSGAAGGAGATPPQRTPQGAAAQSAQQQQKKKEPPKQPQSKSGESASGAEWKESVPHRLRTDSGETVELRAKIGEGAQGIVFRGVLGKNLVAVKIESLAGAQNAAKTLRTLNNAGCRAAPWLFGSGVIDEHRGFTVMELLSELPLTSHAESLSEWVPRVREALHAVHDCGVVMRDVRIDGFMQRVAEFKVGCSRDVANPQPISLSRCRLSDG